MPPPLEFQDQWLIPLRLVFVLGMEKDGLSLVSKDLVYALRDSVIVCI